jgi:hypothetical protein
MLRMQTYRVNKGSQTLRRKERRFLLALHLSSQKAFFKEARFKRAAGKLSAWSSDFIPFSKDIAKKRLDGKAYPILPYGNCRYIVAAFTGDDWLEDASCYRGECVGLGLDPALEHAEADKEGRVWIFFSELGNCATARKMAKAILDRAIALNETHQSFIIKCRIYKACHRMKSQPLHWGNQSKGSVPEYFRFFGHLSRLCGHVPRDWRKHRRQTF